MRENFKPVEIHAGDILAYYKAENWIDDAIKVFEYLEGGEHPREYYHIAIAASQNEKIEALFSGVQKTHIVQNGQFDVIPPPLTKKGIQRGLRALHGIIGERYDKWLILDDMLRYSTGGLIHLPKKFIEKLEEYEKICSTSGLFYLQKGGFRKARKVPKYPPPSPQDLVNLVRTHIHSQGGRKR